MFDGDWSPRHSGENSPHSMESTPAGMECGGSSPLYAGDSSPSKVQGAVDRRQAVMAPALRDKSGNGHWRRQDR
jgi:hypothetical protein